ncbi:unnamed protein product [Nippostrongylus brasiliensis]|uniref:Uncharacterized protein n=1 Tax=Nippostrongylus brasiliensis TaxID=27835 RepID=A0A0N4Y9D1_NIPBR|nr:unnamed protein product [Nippostrongylus brasiliensis]
MSITNTTFRNSPSHKISFYSGNTRSQIDYVLVRRRDAKLVSDARVSNKACKEDDKKKQKRATDDEEDKKKLKRASDDEDDKKKLKRASDEIDEKNSKQPTLQEARTQEVETVQHTGNPAKKGGKRTITK